VTGPETEVHQIRPPKSLRELVARINELHCEFIVDEGRYRRSRCGTCGWGWPCETSAAASGTRPYSVSE